MCKHFALPATLEAGSLYLTPFAYSDPRGGAQSSVKNVTAGDVRGVLGQFQKAAGKARKGRQGRGRIRPEVRSEVRMIAARMTPQWKNTSYNSVFNNYIVRR